MWGRGRVWVGCAVGLVIGCGGRYQLSSAEFPAGGTGSLGGFGSAPAGASGALGLSGAGTGAGGAGAGGAGAGGGPDDNPPGCVGLQGIGVDIEVTPTTYSFCRGEGGEIPIANLGGLSSGHFSCCAVSDTSPKYSLVLDGTQGSNLMGYFVFTPPASAPLGQQNLNVTCGLGGPLVRPISIQVLGVPEITSVTTQIHPPDTVKLQGSYLTGGSVRAQTDTGDAIDCVSVSADDSAIACKFSHIAPGEYTLTLQNAGCPVLVSPLTVFAP